MHPVMERAAERMAKNDRAMPKVPGAGVQLTVENSTGHWRTGAREGHHAHVATASKRFGVKPSGGAVSDIYAGTSNGQDDGSAYFDEWRESGGIDHLPKAKTRAQDHLKKLCVAYIAGQEMPDVVLEGMREFISKIIRTDPDHGSAWRLAMGIAGLYRN
jgi:hypothetical protein